MDIFSEFIDMDFPSVHVPTSTDNIKFGNPLPSTTPATIKVDPAVLLMEQQDLPYSLRIGKLPPYSRVETQIKLELQLHTTDHPSAPAFNHLKLAQDLVSKNKYCLAEELPASLQPTTLYMDAYVLTSDLKNSCQICERCTERERKRSSRGTKSSGKMWDSDQPKKAIIFNSKELVPLTVVPGCDTKFDLSARIICYCRHHKELEGFKILVVLKDFAGNVVAKQLSTPILIMDRKKSATTPPNSNKATLPESGGEIFHQLSPPESASASEEPTFKKARLSNTTDATSPFSDTSTSINRQYSSLSLHNQQFLFTSPTQQPQLPTPTIQKIIPQQGLIRGGIEVTILGFNFRPGLLVKFGVNQALATHCWSETTIVTYLPPAAQPGQVLVSFENQDNNVMFGGPQQQQVFTYTDDSDRQLIELALQIVGLKMNGKLDDAKNIAKRIVGTDTSPSNNNNNSYMSSTTSPNSSEWFDSDNKNFAKLNKLVEFFESRTNNDSDLKKWSGMKTSEIFGEEEEEYFADNEAIPSYKSIFPGPESTREEAEVTSDSSEDMVVNYINHPRKTVENDKMLIFFWIPALVAIFTIFFMVYVMGFQLNSNIVFDKIVQVISSFS
ncbi:hypothetical protein Cantr_02531 [Candida viswanathii]|uniref:IPT/TIG domain-containing protein n=1 Tax=Candida viswanathii TaxID=5486 RepID=A0A367YMR5_9ASCO|nr:hypothetical protein Cantr_02531 [Candida viswanathii]